MEDFRTRMENDPQSNRSTPSPPLQMSERKIKKKKREETKAKAAAERETLLTKREGKRRQRNPSPMDEEDDSNYEQIEEKIQEDQISGKQQN